MLPVSETLPSYFFGIPSNSLKDTKILSANGNKYLFAFPKIKLFS